MFGYFDKILCVVVTSLTELRWSTLLLLLLWGLLWWWKWWLLLDLLNLLGLMLFDVVVLLLLGDGVLDVELLGLDGRVGCKVLLVDAWRSGGLESLLGLLLLLFNLAESWCRCWELLVLCKLLDLLGLRLGKLALWSDWSPDICLNCLLLLSVNVVKDLWLLGWSGDLVDVLRSVGCFLEVLCEDGLLDLLKTWSLRLLGC